MKKTKQESAPDPQVNDLEQAIEVRNQAFADRQVCIHEDKPKFTDAYARAANVVIQLEKNRRKDIASFTDDELVARIKSLPDRRREAIITAVQGVSLAGKPLFG